MSRRSKVWNGLTEPLLVWPVPVLAYEPVMKGTFWPTRNLASSLSSVWMLGCDRMLALAVVSSARARKPRLRISWPAIVTAPRTTPRFRPWPSAARLAAPSMMLLPLPRWPKLVPPITLVPVLPSFRPPSACHCTPSSAALSALTSAISDSITTCAWRMSSLSTIARMFRYSGSGAVMISELVAGSAWIMPDSGPPLLLPLAAEGCWIAGCTMGCPGMPPGCPGWVPMPVPPADRPPVPPTCGLKLGSAEITARSVCASRVACALRR